eukprot:2066932-Prymnesium_polylepis.1
MPGDTARIDVTGLRNPMHAQTTDGLQAYTRVPLPVATCAAGNPAAGVPPQGCPIEQRATSSQPAVGLPTFTLSGMDVLSAGLRNYTSHTETVLAFVFMPAFTQTVDRLFVTFPPLFRLSTHNERPALGHERLEVSGTLLRARDFGTDPDVLMQLAFAGNYSRADSISGERMHDGTLNNGTDTRLAVLQ